MSQKYRNKYRIESNRMPGWDYSGNGRYFITLVTQNRECNLGQIINDKLVFSDFGRIVKNEWEESFEIRKELRCDEFIIMPNHLHAIVVLVNGNRFERDHKNPSELFRKPISISSFIAGVKSAINSGIDDYIDENQLSIPKYNRNNHFFQ